MLAFPQEIFQHGPSVGGRSYELKPTAVVKRGRRGVECARGLEGRRPLEDPVFLNHPYQN